MAIQRGDRFYGCCPYSDGFPSISIHEYELVTMGKKQGTAFRIGDTARMSRTQMYANRMDLYARVGDAEQLQVCLEAARGAWAARNPKKALPALSEFDFFAYRSPIQFDKIA